MKVIETFTQIYPIPDTTLKSAALVRGLDPDAMTTAEILTSKEYRLADADIKSWLSVAPDISQSGISFNLTDKMRESLKKEANVIYKEYSDPRFSGTKFGHKGSRL